jgi:hypothetical protein
VTDSRFHEPFTRGGTEGGIQNGYLQSSIERVGGYCSTTVNGNKAAVLQYYTTVPGSS